MLPPPPTSTLSPYTTLFRSLSFPFRAAAAVSSRSPAFCFAGPWQSTQYRSEEHTSELQSHSDLVCRLLLEKKKPDAISRSAHESTFAGGRTFRYRVQGPVIL